MTYEKFTQLEFSNTEEAKNIELSCMNDLRKKTKLSKFKSTFRKNKSKKLQ